MDQVYDVNNLSDTDTASIEDVITRPSEIALKKSILDNNHNSDTDSDDYDENNILAVGRRRKSFIRNSLKKFSVRANSLPTGVKNTLIIDKNKTHNNFLYYLCCYGCFKPST